MIEQNLKELLEEKVTLDIEGIDRPYLNAYQPMLQTGGGVSAFFKQYRGAVVASTVLMAPMKPLCRRLNNLPRETIWTWCVSIRAA